MFHLFSFYFSHFSVQIPESLFTIIIFLFASSCLALREKYLALITNVKKSRKMFCESDVNPMTTPNTMIYRSLMCIQVYGHELLAWLGVHVSSAHHIHSWRKKGLMPYRLPSFYSVCLCMCKEEINISSLRVSTTTADKIRINHLKENPPNICGFGQFQLQEPQKS